MIYQREHEAWLEDEAARKAARTRGKKPPIPPRASEDRKREDPVDDIDERMARGEI